MAAVAIIQKDEKGRQKFCLTKGSWKELEKTKGFLNAVSSGDIIRIKSKKGKCFF